MTIYTGSMIIITLENCSLPLHNDAIWVNAATEYGLCLKAASYEFMALSQSAIISAKFPVS